MTTTISEALDKDEASLKDIIAESKNTDSIRI